MIPGTFRPSRRAIASPLEAPSEMASRILTQGSNSPPDRSLPESRDNPGSSPRTSATPSTSRAPCLSSQ